MELLVILLPRRQASQAKPSQPSEAKQTKPGHHAATHSGVADAHGTLAGDSVMSDVPEPERSLMPRKDALRKFQQAHPP